MPHSPLMRTSSASTLAICAGVLSGAVLLGSCDAPTHVRPGQPEGTPTLAGVPVVGGLSTRSPEAGPLSRALVAGPLSTRVPGLVDDDVTRTLAVRAARGELQGAGMNGPTVDGVAIGGAVDGATAADPNVAGTPDLVWQNAYTGASGQSLGTGQRSIWHMTGTTWNQQFSLLQTVPPAWRIAASADFDADGDGDLVWQNLATGDRSIWLMVGNVWQGAYALLPKVAVQWEIAAAADFTGDNKPDLVWQNVVTGDRSIWHMNGAAWPGGNAYTLLPKVSPEWRIAAAGDFTGDNKPDLVWQHAYVAGNGQPAGSGQRSIWHMNGVSWPGGNAYTLLQTVPAQWFIAAAADFTGDNKRDLVWQNVVTGQRSVWHMNGTQWPGQFSALPTVPPSWRIATHLGGGGTIAPPPAPSNLVATAISSSQINLTWTDNSTNESGFRIERCTVSVSGVNGDRPAAEACSNFSPLATLGAGVTTYQNTGLPGTAAYCYRVRSLNIGGVSDPSNVACAQTHGTPPAGPSNLVATAPAPNQVNLTWTDVAINEHGYRIHRCGGSATCTDLTQIATLGVGATSYQDNQVQGGTTYRYRVYAFNAAGSDFAEVVVTTPPVMTIPTAPTGLTTTAVGSTTVDLSWTDASSNEQGFSIERCTGVVCTNFAQVGTAQANVATFQSTGLAPATTYGFRVRSTNSAGSSEPSNAISVTTLPTPPAAPSGLGATRISDTQINLAWTDGSNNETGFAIEACDGAGCSDFASVHSVAANVASAPIQGLTPSTSYSFRVRAYRAENRRTAYSGYTNTATTTTMATGQNRRIRVFNNGAANQALADVVRLKLAPNANLFTDADSLSDDRFTTCQRLEFFDYISPTSNRTFNYTTGSNYSVLMSMGTWQTDFGNCPGSQAVWSRRTSFQLANDPWWRLRYVITIIDVTEHTAGTLDYNVLGSYLTVPNTMRVEVSQGGVPWGTINFQIVIQDAPHIGSKRPPVVVVRKPSPSGAVKGALQDRP